MLILAFVFLTSGAGCYFISSIATSASLLIASVVLCNLLTAAGGAILLFELVILWQEASECPVVDADLSVTKTEL